MNKNEKIVKILLNIYMILFIFSMVNKEFLPCGLDLRLIELPLGVLMIIIYLINSKFVIKVDKEDEIGNKLIVFYILAFALSISWFWNGLKMNEQRFINELILLSNVFIACIVIYFYKNKLQGDFINKIVIWSCIVLSISMILVYKGVPFEDIMGADDVQYMYNGSEEAHNKNLYGDDFRVAGYASDPNYATLLLLIGLISIARLKKQNKILKIIISIYFILCMGLSFSKTIISASIFLGIYIFIINVLKVNGNKLKVFNRVFLSVIMSVIIIIPFIADKISFFPTTLTTRFTMWQCAGKLFLNSPIIGNGLTSFRSYFAIKNWYVQAHSTYWQILSELGIIGMILYLKILLDAMDKSINNKFTYFLVLVYVVWISTCETIALPFSIFIIYILNLDIKKKCVSSRILFFLNSISDGGAERVCINLADEMIKEGYDIDFILMGNNISNSKKYKINDKINIFELGINEKNKMKKILNIFFAIPKVNKIIDNREKKGKYCLITSHLPMSNIVTRFSKVKNEAIYVLHTTMNKYEKEQNKLLFRIGLRFVYGNKKIVTVSNGLNEETVKKYKFKNKLVKTIYNPIDKVKIDKLKKEPVDITEKYFVQIGRFDEAKRQDRMIDVFYKGKFYQKYKLLFCGVGKLENKIKEKVEKLGLKDKVIFLGWQSNVYKWMYNSEMLISTSDFEAFPMNLIEAFACGTKVVSSNCEFGPNEILLDEYANYLVKTDDVNDYINKINKALEKYPVINNSILKKCDARNIVKEYLEFYKE